VLAETEACRWSFFYHRGREWPVEKEAEQEPLESPAVRSKSGALGKSPNIAGANQRFCARLDESSPGAD
jgi:hypothetical protein